jgi:hypothetical protein
MLRVEGGESLDGVIETLSGAHERILAEVQATADGEIGGAWQAAIDARSTTAQQARIFEGARVEVDEVSLTFHAAESSQPLSGGLVPSQSWGGAEFGGDPREVSVTRLGKSRTQVVGGNFGPKNPEGRVVLPALREVAPAVVESITDAVQRGIAGDNPDIEVG